MDETLTKIAFVLYSLTFIIGLWEYFARRRLAVTLYLFILAVGVNLFALLIRGIVAKHLPFASKYEALTMYVFSVAIVALVLAVLYKYRLLILSVIPLLLVFLVLAITASNRAATPLMPVLRTPLFGIHVVLAFLGYAFYSTNFSLIFLMKSPPDITVKIVERSVEFGLFFLGAGIAVGAMWAALSWGNWWTWDPKETWSLITFLIYLLYIHMRSIGRPKKALIITSLVAGYVSLFMTFWGINLLKSIHAY